SVPQCRHRRCRHRHVHRAQAARSPACLPSLSTPTDSLPRRFASPSLQTALSDSVRMQRLYPARGEGTGLAAIQCRNDYNARTNHMADSPLTRTGETPPVVNKGHGIGSVGPSDTSDSGSDIVGGPGVGQADEFIPLDTGTTSDPDVGSGRQGNAADDIGRSEEHTSELQSRENLVCRLLLEKKKDSNK